MANKQILSNTSTYVNIIYSEKQSYETLVKKGVACVGDLVITADKTNPYGILHTHSKKLYFLDPKFEDNLIDKLDERYVQPSPAGGIVLPGYVSADGIATEVISVKNDDGIYDEVLNILPDGDHYLVSFAPDVVVDITKLYLNDIDVETAITSLQLDLDNKLDSSVYDSDKSLTDSSISDIRVSIADLEKKLKENFDTDASTFNWGNLQIAALINDLNKIKADIADVSTAANKETLDPSVLDEFKTRVENIESDIEIIDEVAARALIDLDRRITLLDDSQDSLFDSKAEVIKSELQKYTDTEIAKATEHHALDISVINSSISGVNTQIEMLDTSLGVIEKALEKAVADSSVVLADVSTKISNLDSSIVDLNAKILSLESPEGGGAIDSTALQNAIEEAVNRSKDYTNDTLHGYALKTDIDPVLTGIQEKLDGIDVSLLVTKEEYVEDTSMMVGGMSQLSDRFNYVESEAQRLYSILYAQVIPALNNIMP